MGASLSRMHNIFKRKVKKKKDTFYFVQIDFGESLIKHCVTATQVILGTGRKPHAVTNCCQCLRLFQTPPSTQCKPAVMWCRPFPFLDSGGRCLFFLGARGDSLCSCRLCQTSMSWQGRSHWFMRAVRKMMSPLEFKKKMYSPPSARLQCNHWNSLLLLFFIFICSQFKKWDVIPKNFCCAKCFRFQGSAETLDLSPGSQAA